jgi:predicted transcriptional regulator
MKTFREYIAEASDKLLRAFEKEVIKVVGERKQVRFKELMELLGLHDNSWGQKTTEDLLDHLQKMLDDGTIVHEGRYIKLGTK